LRFSNLISTENADDNDKDDQTGGDNQEEDFDKKMNFKILSPGNGDVFGEEGKIFVNLSSEKDSGIKKYKIYINGKYVVSTSAKVNIDLSKINNLKKQNILKIVAVDARGNMVAKKIIFSAI
jgi:hypothetical protein